MPWTETDIAFKKLNNKRITTNVGKGINEERSASSININADEIWGDTPPGVPPSSTTSVVEVYDYAARITLIEDLSVPNQQAWFATTITNTVTANNGSSISESARLMDWISDKYDALGTIAGNGYEVKVYDKDDLIIPEGDSSQWFFDYQTGILIFRNANTDSGSVSSRAPFKIVGYRYIGSKGAGSVNSVGGTNGIITDLMSNAPITTTGNVQLDLTYSPTWSGQHAFTYSPGSTSVGSNHAVSIQGVPISTASGALIEFGITSAFNGGASAFTGNSSVNGGTYLAIAAATSFVGDFLHFGDTQASFSSKFRIASTGLVVSATGYQVGSNRIVESILSGGGQAYGSSSGILNVNVSGNGFSSFASGDTLTLTLTNNITGSGTTNTIAMFTPSGSQLGNSSVVQNSGGTQITLGASGAAISIGSAGFTSNGTFNLPAATNTAGGIYFGTDSVIYRTGSGSVRFNGNWTVDGTLSAGAGGLSVNGQGRVTVEPRSAGSTPVIIRSHVTDDNSTSVKLLELQTSAGSPNLSVDSNGNLRSRTKSFDIPHPIKLNKRLVYGVLEGPEHGAYHRGEASGRGFVRVDLPEYWSALVHLDFTVILTSMCDVPVRIVSKDARGFVVAACGILSRWRNIRFAFHAEGSRRDANLVVEQDA